MSQGIELIVQVKLKDSSELNRTLNSQRQKIPLYDELKSVKDDFESASLTYHYPDEQISDYGVKLTTYEALMKELQEKIM